VIRLGEPFTLHEILFDSQAKPLSFLWLSPGSFLAGSPKEERGRTTSERQFWATLSQGYWLSQHAVTNAQWRNVLIHSSPKLANMAAADPNRPVTNINWFEASEFCTALTNLIATSLPGDYRYDLPTQLQWQYACRSRRDSPAGFVSEAGLDEVAWHKLNSNGSAHSVGEKTPNSLGFYDMLGNVWEWCYDGPDMNPDHPVTDWIGPAGPLKAVMGGCYLAEPASGDLRCSCRTYTESAVRRPWCGFRVSLRL
jgi:formylglycine-generating enzyme required for sulfatase activity